MTADENVDVIIRRVLTNADTEVGIGLAVDTACRLWRRRRFSDALDVAGAGLYVAKASESRQRLRVAKWLVGHAPSSATLIELADALLAHGNVDGRESTRIVKECWRAARLLAQREGEQSAIVAIDARRARRRNTPIVEYDLASAIEEAGSSSSYDVGKTALLATRRKALRKGRSGDAASLTRALLVHALRHRRAVDARKLARRALADAADSPLLALIAEVQKLSDRPRAARNTVRHAIRRAREEGNSRAEQSARELLATLRPRR